MNAGEKLLPVEMDNYSDSDFLAEDVLLVGMKTLLEISIEAVRLDFFT